MTLWEERPGSQSWWQGRDDHRGSQDPETQGMLERAVLGEPEPGATSPHLELRMADKQMGRPRWEPTSVLFRHDERLGHGSRRGCQPRV